MALQDTETERGSTEEEKGREGGREGEKGKLLFLLQEKNSSEIKTLKVWPHLSATWRKPIWR